MWKISGARRFVIMRVFEGGEGSTSGGKLERSRDRFDLFDDALERCGDGVDACMLAVGYARKNAKSWSLVVF